MTGNEWASICDDLNGTFAGGWPPDRAQSFWRRFGDMDADKFTSVMDSLAASSRFAPTPSEFVERAKQMAGAVALPWADVWAISQEAAHRCGFNNANAKALAWAESHGVDTSGMWARNVLTGEAGDTPGAVLACEVIRAVAGDAAAEWFATYGRAAILSPSAAFGDDEWGTKAIRELGESYANHAAAQPLREARALAAADRPALGA